MKYVIYSISIFIFANAFANASSEELEVVRHLVRMIMSSPERGDNMNDRSGEMEITPRYNHYSDLFCAMFSSNQVGFSWTPTERQLAFENFINSIPVLSTNGNYRAIATHAGIAVGYCCDHGVSNVLFSAMQILSSKDSYAQSQALRAFEQFAVPSQEINRFAVDMLTNVTMVSSVSRSYFLNAYANVLRNRRDECPESCFSNGVSVVASAVNGADGAIVADRLLLTAYPTYESSSNRFCLALSALMGRAHPGIWSIPAVERYFIPITNRLLSIQGPLPEVEELR